ncbi:MAG: galactose mutarotase [Muribaculaceae bacterium]|nr:galactose mutarotase [Muribaculaceae bacterium]
MKVQTSKVDSPKGEITLYTLSNSCGSSVTLSSLGAGIVSVIVPDKDGRMADVALGYANPADYFYDGPCAGKVPGRYANRIARGNLRVDGRQYQLAINNGPNALHGGPEGFQNKIWESRVTPTNEVVFTLFSPDGDESYPGNMQISATYTLAEDTDTLRLTLRATTDAPSVVNLTNHCYWNLDGHNSGSVLDHTLSLAASRYLPTDDTLIPTGTMDSVEGTPMDFTSPKTIGRDIKESFPALVYGKGYDNCWVIDHYDRSLRTVATLAAPLSGRTLEVATTQPAVQVYTGNWLAGSPLNKEGRSYNDYDGVAIECQAMPDSPNHPDFPSTQIYPGDQYQQIIEFRFKN